MASIEALDKLERSTEVWDEYVSRRAPGRIDLRNANLSGWDLRDRTFANCDLTASNLESANLDNARIFDSDLTSAVLSDVSLVGCKVANTIMRQTELTGAVIRRSTLTDIVIDDIYSDNVFVEDCTLTDSQIFALKLGSSRFSKLIIRGTEIRQVACTKVAIQGVTFTRCNLYNFEFTGSQLSSTTFETSTIEDWNFQGVRFRDNIFEVSRIRRLRVETPDTCNLDFTGSTLVDVQLECIDLPSAVLLNTAVIRCTWPNQRGRVTLTGAYLASPFLLRQPIQDVKGVSPLLRREIADAQFLISRRARASKRRTRLILRIWGMTSAYGQSLGRLAACCCIAIVINTLFLLLSRGQLIHIGGKIDLNSLSAALAAITRSFVGSSTNNGQAVGAIPQVILAVSRIEGYVALGVGVSIAAVKLNRLSSE